VITLSDQPLVTADALNRILETRDETGKDIVASEYADTHGVPLFIGKNGFSTRSRPRTAIKALFTPLWLRTGDRNTDPTARRRSRLQVYRSSGAA
jgi:hypothetical protein